MTKNVIRKAAFDAKEPDNPLIDEDGFGEKVRATYGNSRWSVSNIRQWLNSSVEAGKWFTKQHDYDEAPTADKVSNSDGAYADAPGFLAGFSSEVIQHFTKITNTTALCEDDGGGSETTDDYVFLPSYTEMGFGNNYGIAEGTYLSIKFHNEESRGKGSEFNEWYLLRTCLGNNYIHVVCWDGTASDGYASSGIGLVPLIVLH